MPWRTSEGFLMPENACRLCEIARRGRESFVEAIRVLLYIVSAGDSELECCLRPSEGFL